VERRGEAIMTEPKNKPVRHSRAKEPKFCRCRLCHEHFYAETIAQARAACQAHAKQMHPNWPVTACFCPD
jgi:hypothetical protein